MQELIDKIVEIKDLDNIVQLMILTGESIKLLEKEKEQIVNAYEEGRDYGFAELGIDYYETTYNK